MREALDTNPLPEKVQVTVDCPPSLPPVLADIDQVRIVFANLIRNAGEAMPDGGRLSITARREDAPTAVAGLLPAGGRPAWVAVAAADN